MENRNSIAGNVPGNNLSKNLLTNSQERPLSFTEGFDEHGAHYSELSLTSLNKNNSDITGQAATRSKLTMVARSKKSTGAEPTPSISSSKSGKHVKMGKKSNIKSVSDDSEAELDRDVHSLNSQESRNSNQTAAGIPAAAAATRSSKSNRRLSGEWEILEGLKAGQSFTQNPGRYAGFMMKNRKWPMKGWHKRFFSLENGYLTYAKSSNDIERGKYHGQVDVGLSVIVCKSRGHRIDMDADDTIYHLKTKTLNEFEEWKTHLRDHRLYRQNAISYGCNRDVNDIINMVAYTSTAPSPDTPTEDLQDGDLNNVFVKSETVLERNSEVPSPASVTTETTTTFPKASATFGDQKAVLLFSEELNEIQLKLFDLGSLLSNIQEAQQAINNVPTSSATVVKKDKSKKHAIGRSNKKEKRLKELLVVPDASPPLMKCSSNPSLANDEDLVTPPPQLMTHSPFLAPSTSAHEQFYRHAEYIHSRLKKLCNQMLATERSKVSDPRHAGFGPQYVQSLKHNVTELRKQNAEYRSRLARIHHESTLHDPASSSLQHPILTPTPSLHRREVKSPAELTLQAYPQRRSLVSSESLDSQNNEFYDAPDQLDPSTEGSEEEEEEDEMSDSEMKFNPSLEPDLEERFSRFQMRRRSRLPSPSVESDISIWGLLRKNIGKDLSKISMPVGMNEPLNALQRLCEELEYSELLERAADIEDPYERMVWVAVFTVSSYSSTFTRAGYKPFNPLLGETYECDRPEKGWRFVAEQVSHHPPVSASYCESKDFTMWQDIQVKTKFWGKSMEVQPIGLVNLVLTRHKENYTWNKATSCIHNILGGQRWVEHYGEVILTNHKRGIVCKLNYVKSSYFSAKKYEVYGHVCSVDNETPVHHLFGRWNESMFHGQSESSAKCIWRPGALPPDHHLYYGFTKFAMELNEIDPDQVKLYPITDTRFRPDQRLLECGKIEEAESEKRSVEQKQREMRKLDEFSEENYLPKWFTKRRDVTEDKESYEYNGMYWNKRKNPGFAAMNLPQLW